MSEKTKSKVTRNGLASADQRWESDRALQGRVMAVQQISGNGVGRVILPSTTKALRIGRDAGADFFISDDRVSRSHAEIRLVAAADGKPSLFVKDLGSSNGSALDGSRLVPEQEVEWLPGSVLDIGPSCRLMALMMSRDDAEALVRFSENPDKDPATGALARKSFAEALQRETDYLCRNPEQEIGLVVFRVIEFAEEGIIQRANADLHALMGAIRRVTRAGTVPGRMSEFDVALILRKCDIAGAHAAIERFSEAEIGRAHV